MFWLNKNKSATTRALIFRSVDIIEFSCTKPGGDDTQSDDAMLLFGTAAAGDQLGICEVFIYEGDIGVAGRDNFWVDVDDPSDLRLKTWIEECKAGNITSITKSLKKNEWNLQCLLIELLENLMKLCKNKPIPSTGTTCYETWRCKEAIGIINFWRKKEAIDKTRYLVINFVYYQTTKLPNCLN